MSEKTTAAKLAEVQVALKAPKSQYNSFGKYAYRSCEDILEAAKPLCFENGLLLTITDEVIDFKRSYRVAGSLEDGTALFVKATATVRDLETSHMISANAYAEIETEQKGMTAPQMTGSASSYARKYALNALFCIDDTKDDDTRSNAPESRKTYSNGKTPAQAKETAQKGATELQTAKADLAHAIDAWAARNNADAKKAKQGVMKRPDYDPESVQFFRDAKREFEEA